MQISRQQSVKSNEFSLHRRRPAGAEGNLVKQLFKPLGLTNGLPTTFFLPPIFSMPCLICSGERRHATQTKQDCTCHHGRPSKKLAVRISDRSTDEQ